jgi:hypothetical protein
VSESTFKADSILRTPVTPFGTNGVYPASQVKAINNLY